LSAQKAEETAHILRGKTLDGQALEAGTQRAFAAADTRGSTAEDQPVGAAAGVVGQGVGNAASGREVGDLVQSVTEE